MKHAPKPSSMSPHPTSHVRTAIPLSSPIAFARGRIRELTVTGATMFRLQLKHILAHLLVLQENANALIMYCRENPEAPFRKYGVVPYSVIPYKSTFRILLYELYLLH